MEIVAKIKPPITARPSGAYFHGDNGAGIGASHQTGWTGLIARAIHLFATTTPEKVLELSKVVAVPETQVRH